MAEPILSRGTLAPPSDSTATPPLPPLVWHTVSLPNASYIHVSTLGGGPPSLSLLLAAAPPRLPPAHGGGSFSGAVTSLPLPLPSGTATPEVAACAVLTEVAAVLTRVTGKLVLVGGGADLHFLGAREEDARLWLQEGLLGALGGGGGVKGGAGAR